MNKGSIVERLCSDLIAKNRDINGLLYLLFLLQKFTFLAVNMADIYVSNKQGPSPQEQLNKYTMELQSYGGTNDKQFCMDHQAVYHSLAPLELDLSAPASEAYVERIFSLCGMLLVGRRNRLKKNLEMCDCVSF